MINTVIHGARTGAYGFTYEEASEVKYSTVKDLLRFCENNDVKFERCSIFHTLLAERDTCYSISVALDNIVTSLIESYRYYNPDKDILLYPVEVQLVSENLKEGAMKAGFEPIVLNPYSSQIVFIHMGNFAKELKTKIQGGIRE